MCYPPTHPSTSHSFTTLCTLKSRLVFTFPTKLQQRISTTPLFLKHISFPLWHKMGECWDLVWFQLWELGCGCQHQPWCKPVAERPLDFIASDFCFKTLQWPSPGNLSKFSSGRCGGGEGGRSTKSSFQPSKGNFQLPYKICFSFAHRGILVSKIIACGNRKWKKTFLEGIQCKTTWRLKFFSFLALKVLSGNWFFSDSSEINGVASYSWLEQINRDS